MVLDPLEHVGDALLHRHEQRGEHESRRERDDVLAGGGHVPERPVEERVQQHERHAAEEHGARRPDGLADEDLDVPEAPLEDRVREGQRDQDERDDRDGREQRRLEAEGPRQRREDQERREADDDAEADPADLLLGLGVLAMPPHDVDEPRDHGGGVGGEVDVPEPRGALEEPRRGGGGRHREQRDLGGRVGERRQVEQRQDAAVADRPREDQEEVQKERRKERPVDVLGDPGELPERVARPRRRHDVDGEGREAEPPEDRGGRRALPGDREEADEEVEEADEGEEEVDDVEAHRRLADRDAADLARADHDEAVREGLAGRAPSPGWKARRRSGRPASTMRSPAESPARAAAPPAATERSSSAPASRSYVKPGVREAVDFAGERNERDPDRGQRERGHRGEKDPFRQAIHVVRFSNPNATHRMCIRSVVSH